MTIEKNTIASVSKHLARVGLGLCLCVASITQAAPAPALEAFARIDQASYCFARPRQLEYERMPPAYLVLQLHIELAYRNPGKRPVILPLEHDRTVYTALKPGAMNVFKEITGLDAMTPAMRKLKELPVGVSKENPIDPANKVFTIIPAGAYMKPNLFTDVTVPVTDHKALLRHDPDLRGHRLYVRLQMQHQELTPTLLADLSDRWVKYGVPWSGEFMTNVVTFDVPKVPPQAPPCRDGQPNTSVETPNPTTFAPGHKLPLDPK